MKSVGLSSFLGSPAEYGAAAPARQGRAARRGAPRADFLVRWFTMEPPTLNAARLAPRDQTMVLIVTTLAGFLSTFMASSINIALPLIESEFHASAVALSWIPLAYILAAGAVLMPVGRISDLYGRMRIFVWGLMVFTVVAFASAFSPSVLVLIVLRGIQGLGAALVFATFTALIILAYPPETRGRALGLNVAGVYLGLTLGPVLGGIIIHNIGWRGLFYIVSGLGVINWALPVWKLRGVDWREPKRARFDVLGSVMYALALSSLLLGFSWLPGLLGVLLIVVGAAGLSAFLWWETRAADPVLNVDLLRHNRVFAYSNVATFINYAATFAMTFLMSLYLQYTRGLNPQTAGFVLVAGTFVQAAFSPVAGRLADRVQARLVASAGMALCVLGLLALVFLSETTPYWYIITVLCVLGLGFAFFSSPIMSAVMGSVEKRFVGVASATVSTMRLAGQNISLGVATLVLAIVVGRHAIGPGDYVHLLTSVRICFAIFTALCVLGVGAALVGPRREKAGGQG
jgi:EmrB/QacA subfamily drug resistance transporter